MRETCPTATSTTTNPIWSDLDANPDCRSERLASKRLSHGTTCKEVGFCEELYPTLHKVNSTPCGQDECIKVLAGKPEDMKTYKIR
jgi:hypothetical protein